MASNSLPDPQNKLWSLAADMIDGLDRHQAAIGIAQNTKTKLEDDLKAAKASQRAFEKAGDAESDLTTARNIANSNAKAAIALTKRMLGDVPTAIKAIWPPGTTEIPDNIPDRLTLLDNTAVYLKDHKNQEIPDKKFTEADIQAAHEALKAARSDLNTGVANRVAAREERDKKAKALRNRMSGLIEELGRQLPKDDDLWYAFGLVPPAGVERPGIAPDDVTLRKLSDTAYLAAWSSTPRAHRYRPFYKVEGRVPDFIPLDPTTETDTLLENLPTTGTLKFFVQATNPAGDSPKSEVVEVRLG